MMHIMAIPVAVALSLVSAQAHAACRLSLDPIETVNLMGAGGAAYDAFERSTYQTDFSVMIRNDGEDDCSGYLSLQNGDGRAVLRGYGGDTLDYRLTSSSGQSDLVSPQSETPSPANAVPFSLTPGRVQVLGFSVRISPNQIVPSGVYDTTLLVRAFDTENGMLVVERPARLATTVRSAMTILLFEGGIPASSARDDAGVRTRQLDFDTLQEGEQANLRVLVQSNDGYAISFRSLNGGALWHENLGRASQIPYAVTFGGAKVALGTGETRTSSFRATEMSGATDTLNVRIGRIGAARAGRYSDEITIRVVPEG
ncbi:MULTISPECIES: hypothetical protein [unclassified Brevundimonas]|uniref:hypothetical protein n=1 Tax=unclassified Brevundimonas TaxID=2622653 RepID=UPI003F91AF21